VLLDARANLYLIDNDKALSGAPNSIFLPQTLHHVFTYYGRPYVSSRGVEVRPSSPSTPLAWASTPKHLHAELGGIQRLASSSRFHCVV